MTVQALLTPFGRNAAYVSAVILLVILILLVLAFWQGREIRFWPPRIGLRPEHGKVNRTAGRNAQWPPASLGGRPAGVAKVFEVTEAAQFYQAIAPNYDQRNSVNLLATHLEVIARLDKLRKAKPTLRVLDLGGGTGQNVATHFFSDSQLRWTYVDSCPAMLSQLRQHLAGRPLYERLSAHLADIDQIHTQLPSGSYDVVLLNLVLSSMPALPDFARIGKLISPGGRLIVADINPLYTHAHPYYQATAADGRQIALRTHPVQPLDVVTRGKEAGLQLTEMSQVGLDVVSYSFIITFACPARPGEGQPPG